MKKGLILFTALFLISGFSAFGAVKAVKEGDVVKVTWTYENPDAASVGLVGDFQGWNLAGALPMAKNASGVWSITLDGTATSEYLYKFNVDGEWTEDPAAPNTFDDGFGGLNGKVVVADLLADAGSATVAAGPKLGLSFATYTQGGAYADFLTKDVKEGIIDGIELDKVGLNLKSYWKFAGNFLPGNRLDIELAVIDNGNMKLWQSNTDGKETPFVTWADGVRNVGDFFFNPFTAFAGQQPYLGHFKYTLTTPWVKVLQAYHYAKSTLRDETYIYTLVKEDNSGDGTVEISNAETLDLGGITLDATVALSKRTTNYGSYGWADVGVAKGHTVTLGYGSLTTGDHLFNYFDGTKNVFQAAYKGKIGDLSLTFDSMFNVFTGTEVVKEAVDGLAAGLVAKYTMGDISVSGKATYGGDTIDTIYGNDDGLNKGKLLFEVAPAAKIDALDLGLTLEAKLDNYTSTNATKPGMDFYAKPSVGYTMGDLYFGLFAKVNYNVIAESTDSTQPMAFKFNEVDAKVSVANLGPGKLITQLAFVKNNGDYVAADDVFADKGFDISMINAYEMADQLTFFLSGVYRAKGEDESDADYKKESVYGVSVGVDKVILDAALKNPRLFALFDYNMNPWDGDYKTGLDQEDGNYRWDNLDAGKGKASARVGVVWSF